MPNHRAVDTIDGAKLVGLLPAAEVNALLVRYGARAERPAGEANLQMTYLLRHAETRPRDIAPLWVGEANYHISRGPVNAHTDPGWHKSVFVLVVLASSGASLLIHDLDLPGNPANKQIVTQVGQIVLLSPKSLHSLQQDAAHYWECLHISLPNSMSEVQCIAAAEKILDMLLS